MSDAARDVGVSFYGLGYTKAQVEEIKRGILALADTPLPRGVLVAAMWLDQIRAVGTEPDPSTIARITADCHRDRPCDDCAVERGQQHEHGCDVERCMYTGGQWIACGGYTDEYGSPVCECADLENDGANGRTVHVCGARPHDCGSQVWDGVWPGYGECVEYGLYTYFDGGWHACGPDHPQASPALSLLHTGLAEWDRERRRWFLKPEHAAYLREQTW